MISARLQTVLRHPLLGVLVLYVFGVLLRAEYALHIHPPEKFISSDMQIYIDLAKRVGSGEALGPWDVTHPLGYPTLLSWLIAGGGLARVTRFQIVVSSLIPPALALLGLATFGRRTAMAAMAVGTLYFPFIEFGALFLTEVHFILCLTLAFAGLFAARGERRIGYALAYAAGGGLALSLAAAMKSVVLPAAAVFIVMDAAPFLIARAPAPGKSGAPTAALVAQLARLGGWVYRTAATAVAALPILGLLARACTRANRGTFCVTSNKMKADFLLGHYGEIANITWAAEEGHGFGFGSPGAYLRHHYENIRVDWPIYDNASNSAAAWRWIRQHPFDAVVLSLDHIYDTYFGAAMWPTYGQQSWQYAHLAQYFFVVFLLLPSLFAVVRLARRGLRALVCSRTALVLSPVLALTLTVVIATGEVRYRIPFDVFFIVLASAFVTGDFKRVDEAQSM